MLYGQERIKRCSQNGYNSEYKKVKDTKDEEPLVMDSTNIEVIKVPGNFKLFE